MPEIEYQTIAIGVALQRLEILTSILTAKGILKKGDIQKYRRRSRRGFNRTIQELATMCRDFSAENR